MTSVTWTARVRQGYAAHPTAAFVAVTAAAYLLAGNYAAQSQDVVAAIEPAVAFAATGGFDLSGLPHHDLPWYFAHDGGLYSDRFPGAIWPMIPAAFLAQAVGLRGNWGLVSVLPAALLTVAAVVMFRSTLRRVLGPRNGEVAAWYVALGTGAFSIASGSTWSHTVDLALISAALLLLGRDRTAAGFVVLGLLVPVRPVQAVAVAVAGLALGWLRRSWRTPVVAGLAAAPGAALLVAWNGLLFGRWGASNGHELGGSIAPRWTDLPANVVGALFSPARGLIFYYPVVVVGLLGLRAAWRQAADWERAAALAGVAGLVTQLLLNRYTGGDSFFGPRLLLEPLAFALPVLARAAVIGLARIPRGYAAVVLGAGVFLHLLGAVAL